jgi:hypothetical protein
MKRREFINSSASLGAIVAAASLPESLTHRWSQPLPQRLPTNLHRLPKERSRWRLQSPKVLP